MSRDITLLAVPHFIQGSKFHYHVKDENYELLVESFLSKCAQWILEEAAGHSPSIAQELAAKFSVGYIDIDPTAADRNKHGIADQTQDCQPIDL